MVKKLAIVLVLAACAGLVWYFFFNRSDRDQVIDALHDVAGYVSKEDGEKTSGMLLKSQLVGSYFADKCVLALDEQMFSGEYTPEDICANLVRTRQFFNSLKLTCHEIEVNMPSENEAVIDFTCRLRGLLKRGEQINEVRDIRAQLRKESGRWHFYSFKIREVLKR